MQELVDYWVVADRCLIEEERGVLLERACAFAVRGSRIVQVEPGILWRESERAEQAKGTGVPIHDVGRCPVVPSFVNGHSHLAMAPLRGITSGSNRLGNVVADVFFALETQMTPEDVRLFTRFGAFESLLCGVGEVWDHFYFGESVAYGLVDAGMTGVVAPTLQDLSGPGKLNSAAQLAATREIATHEKFSNSGIRAAVGPHATDTVSDRLLAEARSLALELNLPVHLHVAQSYEEMKAAEVRFPRGLGDAMALRFEGCRVLFAHGLHLSAADCDRFASAGWVLAYCPFSQLQFGFLSPLATWIQAGGAWVLGTDCVASNDALDVQRELPFVGGNAAISTSFSAERFELLKGGRRDGSASVERLRQRDLKESDLCEAEVLLRGGHGRPLRDWAGLGTGIQVGGLANFLVLDPDHPALFPSDDLLRTMAYGSTSHAIQWCAVGGKIRGMRDGLLREVLASEDYRETLIETRRRRDELFERAKIPRALSTF
jgi:5-methylthioadenosine/S-adenosylhomocysteine deaminase